MRTTDFDDIKPGRICYNCRSFFITIAALPMGIGHCMKFPKQHKRYTEPACTEYINRYEGISSYGH